MKSSIAHLVRRTWLSITDSTVSDADIDVVSQVLEPLEREVWDRMQSVDQRHSVRVLSRFRDALPNASRSECAAVLLHDVGKSVSRLGTIGRIAATMGVLRTRRAAHYRDHERLGVDLVRAQGIDDDVIAAMSGRGRAEFDRAFTLADDE